MILFNLAMLFVFIFTVYLLIGVMYFTLSKHQIWLEIQYQKLGRIMYLIWPYFILVRKTPKKGKTK